MNSVEKPQGQADIFRFDQSGALLRKVMESAAVGIALVGIDRRLLYVNNAFASMLGHAAEEILGRDIDSLVPTVDVHCRNEFDRLIAGKSDNYRAECRLEHRSGTQIWVSASASLLRSERTGRPLYVVLQVVDIDREKRAETALAESESRWNHALEAAGQGVWDHDSRTGSIYYSPMWRKMRGFLPGEHIDSAQDVWLSRLHPDDRARIKAVVGKQDAGVDGFETLEYRERHRDGHYIWILSRGRPVEWDLQGNPIRSVGTDTDITRLKETEAQLAEEKQRLKVTLESIGDGVISTDADGRVTFMNPIAEGLTGWTSAEAIGTPIRKVFSIVGESTGKAVGDPVALCLSTGEAYYQDGDAMLMDRDGTGRPIRSSAAPLRTPEGRALGAVLVFQDVTQSRKLQKELAHSASHDQLTGLPNRVAFDRALANAVETAKAERRTHALCFIDLDRFKPVNDSAGHAAGDALLREVAGTIRGSCRADDFAARIGGDEFAVLLADCPLPKARAVADKVIRRIAAIRFEWKGQVHSIGASAGVAAIGPGGSSSLGFAGEADAACYAAKAQGRGRVVVFDEMKKSA